MAELVTRLTVLAPQEEQDFERSLVGKVDALTTINRLSQEWGLTRVGSAHLYCDEEGNLVAFAVTTEAVGSE